MPFTPSHAAAVLPLVGRGGLVPSALVIGSMAPDLPYYLQLGTESALTHSLVGVLTVDLLMALAVFAAWQALAAPASYAAGPAGLRARLAPPLPLAAHLGSVRAAAVLLSSLAIGGLTHVLWDTFTHAGRWGTEAIPWLTEQHGRLEGYRWAQYASSALGLLAVALWLWRWWQRTATDGRGAEPRERSAAALSSRAAAAYWSAIILVAGAVAIAGALSAVTTDAGLRRGVFRALVWGGGAGLVAMLVASLVVITVLRRGASANRNSPSSRA